MDISGIIKFFDFNLKFAFFGIQLPCVSNAPRSNGFLTGHESHRLVSVSNLCPTLSRRHKDTRTHDARVFQNHGIRSTHRSRKSSRNCFMSQCRSQSLVPSWVAVCVYALIALLKAKCSLSQTYYEILQILSITVFEKTPVFTLFSGENYTSAPHGNPNQLTLFDL